MCEPTHSIVQISLKDYQFINNELTESSNELASQFCLGASGRRTLLYAEKTPDKSYLHLSRMGSGHSETIKLTHGDSAMFPKNAKYEANWWDRTCHLDEAPYGGWINADAASVMCSEQNKQREALESFLRAESLRQACEYAKHVSTGSLVALRNFLTDSLRYTERQYMYLQMFRDKLLNAKGQKEYDKLFNELVKQFDRDHKKPLPLQSKRYENVIKGSDKLQAFTKLVIDMTKKREYLNDAWSANELWSSDKKELVTS